MHKIYISAAHKSSGKTTIAIGLNRLLNQKGLRVQPFKKGPDYIDPLWHSQAASTPCFNLDFHLMTTDEINDLYVRKSKEADVALIEGNKGLFDGMDIEGTDSNAALAKQLSSPVILVIDCEGMTRGIAPLLMGYQAFDPNINIAGVILNKVGGSRHEQKLKKAVSHYTNIPVLGAVPRLAALQINERQLGLIPANESPDSEIIIRAIAETLSHHIDLDQILHVTEMHSQPYISKTNESTIPTTQPDSEFKGLKIGIAHDSAFGFYYKEDIESLVLHGVELVTLDLINDESIPDIHGLIIGGGFPERFASELASNAKMRCVIRNIIEAGLPTFAECGGLMYLTQSLLDHENIRHEMCKIIPGDVVMTSKPVGRGYAVLSSLHNEDPVTRGENIPAHEFHYSYIENPPKNHEYELRVVRGEGIVDNLDCYKHHNLYASYCHRRGSGEMGWILPFLQLVKETQFKLSAN